MKRISHIFRSMLSALVTLVLGTSAIALAQNVMDDSGFERIGKPRPGEWLFHFHESGQSFEDYARNNPVKASGRRQVLVFQPVGPFTHIEQDMISKAVLFAGIWFDLPTRVERTVALPEKGWRRIRRFPWQDEPVTQYRTDYFLQELFPRRLPEDAVCYLAITMADLYPDENWNFVFGQASLSHRIGVYSMARYFPRFWGEKDQQRDNTLTLKRCCKVLVHEVGHIFGLSHCIYCQCTMNGSNSLEESDRRPLRLCPLCLKKLQWNRELDTAMRYGKLETFYEKHGLKEEAGWIRKRKQHVECGVWN